MRKSLAREGQSRDRMDWGRVWKILILWFCAAVIVLLLAGEWSVATFGVTYGLGAGGLFYRYRNRVKPFFQRYRLNNYAGFLLLAVLVTVSEETYCSLSGNRTAHPVLWVDLVLVTSMWWVWFTTWYVFLSKRYVFEEKEALLTASLTGVLYELEGSALSNVWQTVFAIPLAVVVYAAIFVLPMQLIPFTGHKKRGKYVVSIFVPFVLTYPVAVLLYVLFSLFQIPL